MIDLKNIVLCKPGRIPICTLNGVDYNTVDYTSKFNDLDEISFTVDKYIESDDGTKITSNGYDSLHAFMEIYVEDIGYFQIKEPQVTNTVTKETKTVMGVSIATELLQKDLVGFTVNTSTTSSLEMLVDGNVNSLGYPTEYITFYNENNPQLSLMDLVLEKAVGWKVGDIDEFLKNKKFSFDDINESVFSFLTKTLSLTARCIFSFDTINKTISAYSENHIGNDTGIIVAERNLLNSVDMQCDSDNIYTRLNVQGKNSLTFTDINYGDTHVFNLDYYKNLNYLKQDTIDALTEWESARDSNRDDYIGKTVTYQSLLEQISEIDNKVPTNGVLNNWDNMAIDELNKNLTYYNSLIKEFQIIAQNTHPQGSETEYAGNIDNFTPSRLNADGTVNHESYMTDLDGQGKETYREIITYVIPNIETAIINYDLVEDDKKDYFKDYLTDWSLYGLVELKAKQSSYEDQKNTLKAYAKAWDDLTDEEKNSHGNNSVTYNQYHDGYVKIDEYLTAIANRTTELTAQKNELIEQRILISTTLSTLRQDMSITGGRTVGGVYTKWFTDEQLQIINLLFHDSDYTNENILTTKLDDFTNKIEIEKELYDDALTELSELSIPQYTFSCDMDNLLSLDEFSYWHKNFKVGNFITLEVSNGVFTRLRLISITNNPFIKTNNLSVTFSNMVTGKDGRNDFSYIFDKAISAAKNSISLANNSSKDSIELSTELLNLLSNSTVFQGKFDDLNLKSLSANEAVIGRIAADFVKSDFADFTDAQIRNLYANTGLITDLTVQDGKITGRLCAVEINADNITTGTLTTDRFLIKGNNGLYYKLNVSVLGEATVESLSEEEQEKLKNGIHGENIIAESITANKIAVSDLTAFKATIASFKIENITDETGTVTGGSFHNILKSNVYSVADGIYMDSNGQFVVGNGDEYIKFIKGTDDKFHFDIKTNVKIDGSLIVDGTIDANKIGVSEITSEKIRAGSITTDKIDTNAITAEKIASNAITAEKIATGAIAVGNLDNSLKSSIDSINNLSVGGRNISLGTSVMTIGTGGYASSQWRRFSTGTLENTDITDFSGIFNGVKITITNETSQVGVVQDNVPLNKGEQYTVSFWARCVSGDSCTIGVQCYSRSGDADTTVLYTVPSTWTRIVKVAKNKPLADNTFTSPLIVLRPSGMGTAVEICGIKLEKGTVATDWTQAPEDITNTILDNSIVNWCYNNNKTYIDGAKIYTGTITAEKIATKSIDATKIDVSTLSAISANLGTVTAGTIQSSNYKKDTTGMQLVLSDGTWNSKNFSIDSSGNVSLNGTIYATSGTLSNLLITGDKGISCEYEFGSGSGTATQSIKLARGRISFSYSSVDSTGGSRVDAGTYIYPSVNGLSLENENGEYYFKTSGMSSSELSNNYDSYVMINNKGIITANGSYFNSRSNTGDIVRLIALTSSNHLHIGSTDISGSTRIISGATGLIQFYVGGATSGTINKIMEVKNNYLTMPSIIRIGTDYNNTTHTGFQQRYDSTTKAISVGNSDSKTTLFGTEVSLSGTTSITSNRTITVSSDRRVKNHISSLPLGIVEMFDYLEGKSFKYDYDTNSAKTCGFIAQDVLSALQKCGLSTDDFAGFCDINGDGSQYALAYEQFIPIMWEEIKRLRIQIKELKGE